MTWSDLTPDIRRLTACARPHYQRAAKLAADPAFTVVGVDLESGELFLKQAGCPTLDSLAALLDGPAPSRVVPSSDSFYFLKSAVRVGQLTRPMSDFFSYAQSALGGPNAVTTTLVGSGLGALGGYGIGKVLDTVGTPVLRAILPKKPLGVAEPDDEELIGKSNWAPALATVGGLVGAVPGLVRGGVALASDKSLLDAFPWRQKLAEDLTGALFIPSIPVDAFNRAVWSSATPNPFGAKSQWGDNEQSLYTPPQAAALMTGLVGAAGAATNQEVVSPWDVARVATQAALHGGMGALAGAATGMLTGKVLGALAGLSPTGQEYAKQTGLWAGLLGGLSRRFF